MSNKPRDWGITPGQLFLLLVALIGGTAVISLPGPLVYYAGSSAWVAPLIALPAGLVPLGVLYVLERRDPGRTMMQHARRALGPFGGGLAVLPILALFLSDLATIPREFANLVASTALPRTPHSVVVALVLIAPVFAVRAGLEVVARLAQILVPIGLATLALVLLLSANHMDLLNLVPVLARGPGPVLRAAAMPAGWYAETLYLTTFLPFGDRARPAYWRAALAGLCTVGVLVALSTAASQAVFGPATAFLAAPVYQISRVVDLATFIDHLDPFLLVAWMATGFIKMSVFLYAFCLCLAQILGLSNIRALVLPTAALTVLIATTWYATSADLAFYIAFTWPFSAAVTEWAAPLLVLVAVLIRGRSGASQRRTAQGTAAR